MEKPILGLDIGGVIIDTHGNGRGMPLDAPSFTSLPAVEGALEMISTLNRDSKFAGNIYLVSKSKMPERGREWLLHNDFYNITGIPEAHLYQCPNRADKVPIVQQLMISHFVDDLPEILKLMQGIVPHLFHFQSPHFESADTDGMSADVQTVKSWAELLPLLRGTSDS